MSKLTSVFILLTSLNLSLGGQVTIKIVIKNLENNTGRILMDFRKGNNEPLYSFQEKIEDRQCIITVKDLNVGKYSFKYFHDENNNKKLDTYWIGAPKEGIGFSNNAKAKFGPPDFEDTIIDIRHDTTLVCIAYYVKL